MRFYAHPIRFLIFFLIVLHAHAADIVAPASSVSATSISASDKTAYIEAQVVEGKKDDRIEANGKVEMQQGTQKIFADHMTYDQKSGDLFASGSVRVEQPSGTATGPELKTNTTTHVSEMKTPVFEMQQIDANNPNIKKDSHGSAVLMHSTSATYYEYDRVKYTTCPVGSDDWWVHMSELDMDRATQIGTGYNAWIEFEGVPMLYTPWMTFPLDGARHSGLLAPVYANTSIGGAENTIPFYWNIAPNYDYTLSDRNMSTRGTMLEHEFRFIEPGSAGELHYNDINFDKVTGTSRSNLTFVDSTKLGYGFSSMLAINRVSDDNYFRDLAIALADVSQTQLLNQGVLSYAAGGLSASVTVAQYQTLQDALGDVGIPYQRMPQVNLSYQKTLGDAAVSMVNEYVDFRHPTLVEGQRAMLYPSVTYSLLNDPGFYLKPKLGINYTQYDIGNNNTTDIPNTSRSLPIFSMDSGMTFERDMTLGQSEFVQTLEPRVYYVWIPYQNQDFLPVFDTSQAGLSFPQMFSENRFYGNDRIGDANRATVGLTTRLIDGTGGIERLHISLAQQYNFTAPQVNLNPPATTLNSDILISIGGKVTKSITLDSTFDYDPYQKYIPSGGITATYRPETGKLLNMGYNFTQDLVTPSNDVRQANISAQWPLIWHWNAVSRINYDFQQNLMTERLLGLEYNPSCWTLRLIAEKFWYSEISSSNAIYIQLELNDLVAIGNNPISELKAQIPGYTKLNDSKLAPIGTTGQVSP